MAEVARVAALEDLEEQARAVGDLIRDLGAARSEAAKLRAEVVRSLREHRSHQEIADLLKVSRGTAQQIAEGRHTGRRRAADKPDARE